ncbi:MAG: TylF/MycF/NovP-related O-methyltransferase [Gemmatimonas sp.]
MLEANRHKHTKLEAELYAAYAEYFDASPLSTSVKLQAFAKYARRQDLSRFLAKNELFKAQLDVPGVIVECGCHYGQGLLTFSQLSSIYEPFNHTRRVIGFDTFAGFPSVSPKDQNVETAWQVTDLKTHQNIVDELGKAIELHDMNRPVGHIAKATLVEGDAIETIPSFVAANPHIVVSMLYLDFDIYEPTKVAIEQLVPRIPKGGILAFDELNAGNCPGETLALLETLGISNVELRKTPFDPYITYARMGA